MQIGKLQLQQPSSLSRVVTEGFAVSPKPVSVVPKQHQQQMKIAEKVLSEALTDPLERLITNNVILSGKSSKASSKSSKRSAKLRELQTKALEARQVLEMKQLEERLA